MAASVKKVSSTPIFLCSAMVQMPHATIWPHARLKIYDVGPARGSENFGALNQAPVVLPNETGHKASAENRLSTCRKGRGEGK